MPAAHVACIDSGSVSGGCARKQSSWQQTGIVQHPGPHRQQDKLPLQPAQERQQQQRQLQRSGHSGLAPDASAGLAAAVALLTGSQQRLHAAIAARQRLADAVAAADPSADASDSAVTAALGVAANADVSAEYILDGATLADDVRSRQPQPLFGDIIRPLALHSRIVDAAVDNNMRGFRRTDGDDGSSAFELPLPEGASKRGVYRGFIVVMESSAMPAISAAKKLGTAHSTPAFSGVHATDCMPSR